MTAALEAQERSYANLKSGRKKGVKKPRLANTGLPSIILALYYGTTIPEAATESGQSRRTVKRVIDSLRQPKSRIVYISGYERPERGGTTIPIYTLGTKYDVPAPANMTQAEKSARYRAKQKHLSLIKATAGTLSS